MSYLIRRADAAEDDSATRCDTIGFSQEKKTDSVSHLSFEWFFFSGQTLKRRPNNRHWKWCRILWDDSSTFWFPPTAVAAGPSRFRFLGRINLWAVKAQSPFSDAASSRWTLTGGFLARWGFGRRPRRGENRKPRATGGGITFLYYHIFTDLQR